MCPITDLPTGASMKFVAGEVNKVRLVDIMHDATHACDSVRAAVAYASFDNMHLFRLCETLAKPICFYGRYDHTVPVAPEVLQWFLQQKSPELECLLVPDLLHAKVIWWEGVGAYIGSANLTDRAWNANAEAGVYFTHIELEGNGVLAELFKFFASLDSISTRLTKEIYEEMKRLRDERHKSIDNVEFKFSTSFEAQRLIPRVNGFSEVGKKKHEEKKRDAFINEWNETLQLMRTLGERLSDDQVRPSWIDKSVPQGVQADQFLHAYYYQLVREGANTFPVDRFHQANKNRREEALKEAFTWWKGETYLRTHEERTINSWAPLLKEYLSKSRLPHLTRPEFVAVGSKVHAMREHAIKQPAIWLNLPVDAAGQELRAEAFPAVLYNHRSLAYGQPHTTQSGKFHISV
jgi:hypothetical protein